MGNLLQFLNGQLGRIMLLIAAAWVVFTYLNVPPDPTADLVPPKGEISVEVPSAKMLDFSATFPAGAAVDYVGGDRFVFVTERKIVEFQPVDLDVPEAGIQNAPPILPSPGPSLEGALKLIKSGASLTPGAAPDQPKPPDPPKP